MMYSYEKEIINQEMLYAICSYPYKVIPLTDQAKFSFASWNKTRGPMPNKMKDLLQHLDTDKHPFVGEITFYTEESEEHYIQETKHLAIFGMAEKFVPGIGHPKSQRKGYWEAKLEEDKDYVIEVGSKIVHEPFKATFDDIKAL